MGEYKKALFTYNLALPVLEATLGRKHPTVAATYGNMGLVHDSMGDFPKALEYHNRDLEIKLGVSGPEHPDVASTKVG